MRRYVPGIIVKVDGKNLNAAHFAAMEKKDAVNAILADGISKDKAWAGKAYDACVKAVKDDADKKEAAIRQADEKLKLASTPEAVKGNTEAAVEK